MDDSKTYTYAWCLDHGRLHRFTQQEGAWCSALWASLTGDSEESALVDKRERFGEARFFDELPQQVKVQLMESKA